MKQRITIFALTLIVGATVAAFAGEPRVLTATVPAANVDVVRLDAGVGDVEIIGADVAEVSLEVKLEPRRGGFFSSLKTAQREVDTAQLRTEVKKGALTLKIDTDSDDHRFEEHWVIELPTRLAFDLKLGVGDVEVRGLTGDLDLDLGVGDLVAEGISGNVIVELGVGDATLIGAADHYGSVDGSGGVGDTRLTVRGKRILSSGFVGHSAEWKGDGPNTVEISVGVGDARVTLE